jgi:D-glycero-D-manno-heptose 1,7-bisphosphate phosphatase
MNKCIFLDRDGVLNVERGDYTFLPQDFKIIEGVPEAIEKIKKAGYFVIVATNQAGITKGIYTRKQMHICHEILMEKTQNLIDHIYYSPYHPNISASLTRKPDTLMIEKAMAKFDIDPNASWFVGDRCRDVECGQKMGLKTVLITDQKFHECNPVFTARDLTEAVGRII